MPREIHSRAFLLEHQSFPERKFGKCGKLEGVKRIVLSRHREYIKLSRYIIALFLHSRVYKLFIAGKQTSACNAKTVKRSRFYQSLDHSLVKVVFRHTADEIRKSAKGFRFALRDYIFDKLFTDIFKCQKTEKDISVAWREIHLASVDIG